MITDFLIPLGAILLLIDFVLSASWSEWYFNTGLPLVTIRNSVNAVGPPPTADAMETQHVSFLMGRIPFRDFGENTYAFRRSLLTGSGLMHGLISFDIDQNLIIVEGKISPFAFGFILCVFLGGVFMESPEFVVPFILVLACLLAFDYLYLKRELSVASRLWSAPKTNG